MVLAARLKLRYQVCALKFVTLGLIAVRVLLKRVRLLRLGSIRGTSLSEIPELLASLPLELVVVFRTPSHY